MTPETYQKNIQGNKGFGAVLMDRNLENLGILSLPYRLFLSSRRIDASQMSRSVTAAPSSDSAQPLSPNFHMSSRLYTPIAVLVP